MRRFLIFLITLVMIFSLFGAVASSAAAEKVFDKTYTEKNPLKAGTYQLNLSKSAVNTLYVFKPDEIGIYTFTVDTEATIGWWGAYVTGYLRNPNSKTNTIEREIKRVGDVAVIGISSPEEAVGLTITKTGESEGIIEIEYIEYKNVHTPTKGSYPEGDELKAVDISVPHSAVLGIDGFYHLDDAYGPMLYIDLYNEGYSISAAFGSYGALSMKGNYNGTYYNFKTAMKEYNDVLMGTSGVYPLTEDLLKFAKAYGTAQMWYSPEHSPFTAITSGNFDVDTAWMVACYTKIGDTGENISYNSITDMNTATPLVIDYTTEAHVDGTPVAYYLGNSSYASLTVSGASGYTVKYNGRTHKDTDGEVFIEMIAENALIEINGSGIFNLTVNTHTVCSVERVLGTPATHTQAGTVNYWHCNECGKNYDSNKSDARELTADELIAPAKGHVGAAKIDAKPETCLEDGNIEYYYCKDCNADYDGAYSSAALLTSEDIRIPAKGHTAIVYVPAVLPACTESGIREHYRCDDCMMLFDTADADGDELDKDELAIPAKGHTGAVKAGEKAPTCTENGNKSYYICPDCNNMLDGTSDNALVLTEDDIVIEAKGHTDADWISAVTPTCTEGGSIGYYHCKDCGNKLDGTSPSAKELNDTDIILSAEGHTAAVKVELLSATCTENGESEHFYCNGCNKKLDGTSVDANVLTDEELRIYATGHNNVVATEGRKASCGVMGILPHYLCLDCNKILDGTDKDAGEINPDTISIPALDHIRASKIAERAPTCTREGWILYYICPDCNNMLDGKSANSNVLDDESVFIAPIAHKNAFNVPKKAESCTEDGSIAYWSCPDCGERLDGASKDAKILTDEDVIIPAHHSFASELSQDDASHWYECEACGERKDSEGHIYSEGDSICRLCGYVQPVEEPELSFFEKLILFFKNLFAEIAEIFKSAF